ncbi:hypothetical protein E4U54_002471, partial [Claviceps lovelessii]
MTDSVRWRTSMSRRTDNPIFWWSPRDKSHQTRGLNQSWARCWTAVGVGRDGEEKGEEEREDDREDEGEDESESE